MKVDFQKLRDEHLPLLHDWLNQPHVAARWDGSPELEVTRRDYFELAKEEGLERFIAYMQEHPVGYIQKYSTINCEDGWWDDLKTEGIVGIDFFIGPADHLNQGIGPRMIEAFMRHLFEDAAIEKIISDPAPDNLRSIRCLEKAGFVKVGEVVTPDGLALLMEATKLKFPRQKTN